MAGRLASPPTVAIGSKQTRRAGKIRAGSVENDPEVGTDIVHHQLTDLRPGLDPARMVEGARRNARMHREGTRNLIAVALAAGCIDLSRIRAAYLSLLVCGEAVI